VERRNGIRATPSLGGFSGVRGILVYCADYRCSHSITLSAPMLGPMILGCPMLSLALSAKLAASAAPMCGRTGRRQSGPRYDDATGFRARPLMPNSKSYID
jgi:hypothetical protein